MDDFLEEAQKVAVAAAKEAGKIQLKHYSSDLKISIKGNNVRDVVTIADMEADALIRRLILEKFPDHSIITEENEPRIGKEGNEYVWCVDPIDGTMNYSKGSNYFTVSIALLKGEEPLLGVIYNPIFPELYLAVKGKGAFLNGKRIHVANTTALNQAMLCCDFPNKDSERQKLLQIIGQLLFDLNSIRVKGSGTLEMCELARGSVDIHINLKSTPWDYAAASLIVLEAGGVVTDSDGKEWRSSSKNIIAAAGKALHGELLGKVKATLK